MLIPEEQLKALILAAHVTSAEVLTKASEYAKNSEVSFDEAIIQKDIMNDEQLGALMAGYLKIPFIILSRVSIPEEVVKILPEKLARHQKVIPFERTPEGIKLAMVDPTNLELQAMIAKKTGQKIFPHLATERDIINSLHIFRKDLQKKFDELLEINKRMGRKEPPIAKIVDLLIDSAAVDKASDIHIESSEKISLVRFRIDGILHDVLFLSKDLHTQIITRIKVLSNLRTDEHLSPQDGKLRMILDDQTLDLRVSILPMVEGEKVVLRLLSSHMRQLSLIDLGTVDSDLKKVNRAMGRSFGMILSTGPTGSGKTTSIYAILKILNTRDKNITTIEDPVEYRIKGVNQIQVNTKANLTFASGLRSILRQDPNIVFVGEIRDSETAGIAVNAALTGHLVLSTLHTNDAATAIPRLTDMKIEPFLVASTVSVIVAQRLVRKICENCRESLTISEEDLLKNLPKDVINRHYIPVGEDRQIRVYKGKGCRLCHTTGYSGRIGIFEILEVTENLRKLIVEKSDSDLIRKAAIEDGMTTMLDDGLQKVAKGLTTIEEILRVTKVESL